MFNSCERRATEEPLGRNEILDPSLDLEIRGYTLTEANLRTVEVSIRYTQEQGRDPVHS